MKKYFKIITSIIIICFLTISILTISLYAEKDQVIKPAVARLEDLERVQVNYVYDGDTFRTAAGEKVRLIGIDTPEMNWEEGEAEYFARESFQYSREKLLNKSVHLEYDQERRDKYGRLLAYLFLEDGTLFNKTLLEKGYAGLFLVPPNLKYEAIFKEAAVEARTNQLGIWQRWELFLKELPQINWQEAADYLGEEVVLKGKIVDSYQTEKIIFLEFSEEEEDCLQIVIFKYNLNKFPYNPLEDLIDREIMVSGKIEDYKGLLEIVVDNPIQLLIIEEEDNFQQKER